MKMGIGLAILSVIMGIMRSAVVKSKSARITIGHKIETIRGA